MLKRSPFKPKPKGKFYRINYFIQASNLRLLDETGKQIGIVSKQEALRQAQALGVDVVEVAPSADPPVAKLIDFKKFKYLEAKKLRQEKKGQKNVGIKEIRLGPFIGEHDLKIKAGQGQAFLKQGNQLKISIPFHGRQLAHKEFGFQVANKFISFLKDVKIVRPAHFEGRVLSLMLSPDKKG